MRLYVVQRVTAMVMAPLVIGHIAVMIYAVEGGLDAAEILGRTRHSLFWGTYYTVFVLAASFHAAIGVRRVLLEWTAMSRRVCDWVCIILLLVLVATGGRAVLAVTLA